MSTTNVDTEKLKAAIEKSGYRVDFIATQIGISHATLRAVMCGARNGSKPIMKLLSQLLSIDENELYKKAS